jgi:hypothetical protein
MIVTIVEYRDADGAVMAHVASSEGSALDFVRANADYGDDRPWHWAVYDLRVDSRDLFDGGVIRYYDRRCAELDCQPIYG